MLIPTKFLLSPDLSYDVLNCPYRSKMPNSTSKNWIRKFSTRNNLLQPPTLLNYTFSYQQYLIYKVTMT